MSVYLQVDLPKERYSEAVLQSILLWFGNILCIIYKLFITRVKLGSHFKLILSTMKIKKQSKRMSCRKRYKIIKKVAAHNRKVRREMRKKGPKKTKVKDPGVPNSAPFKDEVLQKFRERQQKLEQEKELKKQLRKERRRINRGLPPRPTSATNLAVDEDEMNSEDDEECPTLVEDKSTEGHDEEHMEDHDEEHVGSGDEEMEDDCELSAEPDEEDGDEKEHMGGSDKIHMEADGNKNPESNGKLKESIEGDGDEKKTIQGDGDEKKTIQGNVDDKEKGDDEHLEGDSNENDQIEVIVAPAAEDKNEELQKDIS